jgi:uncharacterized membrane protein YgdD (TMEM256/DUF423 family)
VKGLRAVGVGALLMGLGTIVGALGSHALTGRLSEAQLHSLDTAVRFQMFNALGLMVLGLLAQTRTTRVLNIATVVIIIGTVCFSGGIYLMLLGAPSAFGLVTPLGGVLLIGAWLALAYQLLLGDS